MNKLFKTIHCQTKPYGHCATVAPYKDGVMVAFYNGPECKNEQHVVIQYWNDDKIVKQERLGPKTGNCVLWPIAKDRVGMIYSYFNDTDGIFFPTRPVHRWMYCSNWQTTISFDEEICIATPKQLDTQPSIGYLTRINPVKIKGTWILPLYKEKFCYGLIMHSEHGTSWTTGGQIGMDGDKGKLSHGKLIQPTVWHDGEKLCSLSRNMAPNGQFAWYASSLDMGHTWTNPVLTKVTNTNNSLVVIHDGTDNPWIVWNLGKGRSVLAIGRYDQETGVARPYAQLNRWPHASYPNYCFDYKNNLHIVHSDGGRIARHIITPEGMKILSNNGPVRELTTLHKIIK